ncbi:bacteriohemerythrin [Magnetococcales bacterium HHB-1]
MHHASKPEAAEYRKTLTNKLKDVGVMRFNQAHQKILDQIIQLHGIVDQLNRRKPTEEDWKKIDQTLNFLLRYASDHFNDEEREMERLNYPEYPQHKQQHDIFIGKIKEIKTQLDSRKILFIVDMKFFLLEWLFSHINRFDMRYKSFFKEHNLY